MKIVNLAPLKGKEAVDFMTRFGAVIDLDVEILPCGCMISIKKEPTPVIFYIHVCPLHFILEKVNLECNKRIWRGAIFKPYKKEE